MNRLKKFISNKADFLCFFIAGLVSQTWIGRGQLAWGVDSVFPLKLENYVYQYFYFWGDKVAYSTPDVSKFPILMPFAFILYLWKELGLHYNPIIFQRGLFYLLFVFSGLSASFLYKQYFGKKGLGHLFFGLFYMFNFYSLVIWHSQAWIIFAYVFFPLVLGLIIKGIDKKRPPYYFLSVAVIWTLLITPAYGTPPFMLIHWGVISLYFLYELIVRGLGNIKYLFKSFLALFAGWLVLNAFWLLPQFLFFKDEFTRRLAPGDPYALLKYNSSEMSSVFRFLGPNFFAEGSRATADYPWFSSYQSPLFILLGFLPTIFIFIIFLKKKLNSRVLFAAILYLFSIVLIFGTYLPSSLIVYKTFSFLKLDQVFRSIWQRFMPLCIMFGGILMAYSIDQAGALITKAKTFTKVTLYTLISLVLFVLLVFPIWKNGVYIGKHGVVSSEKIKIPSYYYDTANWFESQPESNKTAGKVLVFPLMKMGVSALQWNTGYDGYYGVYPLLLLTNKSYIITEFDTNTMKKINLAIQNDDSTLIEQYNIEYLTVHNDANNQLITDNDWFVNFNQADKQKIYQSKIFEKKATFGSIEIFKNKSWNVDLDTANSTNKVDYKKISPVEYSVNISNLNAKTKIMIPERGNNGWQVYAVDNSCSDAGVFSGLFKFRDKNKLDNIVFVKDITKNEWTFDPAYIRSNIKESKYTINPDGSLNLHLSVYFKPQNDLDISFLISVLGLIAILTTTFLIFKKRNNKFSG